MQWLVLRWGMSATTGLSAASVSPEHESKTECLWTGWGCPAWEGASQRKGLLSRVVEEERHLLDRQNQAHFVERDTPLGVLEISTAILRTVANVPNWRGLNTENTAAMCWDCGSPCSLDYIPSGNGEHWRVEERGRIELLGEGSSSHLFENRFGNRGL